MTHLTIKQLCDHAGRSRSAVCRALKVSNVRTLRAPGVKGLRVSIADANKFLRLHWPEAGPINQTTKP